MKRIGPGALPKQDTKLYDINLENLTYNFIIQSWRMSSMNAKSGCSPDVCRKVIICFSIGARPNFD